MSTLAEQLILQSAIQQVYNNMHPGAAHLLTGVTPSARALLVYALSEKQQTKYIWIAQNAYQAMRIFNDLSGLVSPEQVYMFETNDVLQAEWSISSPESQVERIRTLDFLMSDRSGIVIIPLSGVRKLLPPKDDFAQLVCSLQVGDEVNLEVLVEQYVNMGYVREHKVTSPGMFSVRGGIIDIYPITELNPVRIELFDTEVDSLRYFDVETQRSIEMVDQVRILPACEYMLLPHYAEQALERFNHRYAKALDAAPEDQKSAIEHRFSSIKQALTAGEQSRDYVMIQDILYPTPHTVLDYISDEAVLCIDDYGRLLENNARLESEESQWLSGELAAGRVLPDQVIANALLESLAHCEACTLYFSVFQDDLKEMELASRHHIQSRGVQTYVGQMDVIQHDIADWQDKEWTIVIMADGIDRQKAIRQTLSEFDIDALMTTASTIVPGHLQIIDQSIHEGVEWIDHELVVLTEQDLFHKVQKKRSRSVKTSNAERLKSYNELMIGDYVVHEHHGIGQYVGMETMHINGVHQDYVSVVYQKDAKLFVPVSQLHLLQKYVATEGYEPKINTLGGTAWAKTKRKVQAQVEDIAEDLVQLYAEREQKIGYAYPPDTEEQYAFESAFSYSETDDQLRSIQEIKHDLQKDKPMDRLLVGDVGYGKTEVALRAIFKVIQEGKQAAFLVPTTVLAQQHYDTIVERFGGFPVKVGLLNRFKTPRQVSETLASLKKGQLDIIVGTHRLLSKDVVFQDLGIVVIDEEQRFGVTHKERLKELKHQVDVLTLTATPIPRTLHMSMLGVRDLSVIETPPANRYPVQTYVMEMNAVVIREAIQREMARGGQVFLVHNRVDRIERRVIEIQSLVPEARISYIHGQMTEDFLERQLTEFLAGDYDVLITTTIIETGIDMPNVNTLIVEDADRMGLSQLYQLRGRVGRSNRFAYAYFMYRMGKSLTEVSENRLKAIKDFTELGSGFKIAMRDLAIRGAGNLLGKQQHGFIESVGFDLYSQMLQEAVERKQQKTPTTSHTVEIDLGIDAYLPSYYIKDERQKIELYKRIRSMNGRDDYQELQDELMDRFGEYDQPVADVLMIGLIKHYSEQILIDTITRKRSCIDVIFNAVITEVISVECLFKALKTIELPSTVTENDTVCVRFTIPRDLDQSDWLHALCQFVEVFSRHSHQIRQEEGYELSN